MEPAQHVCQRPPHSIALCSRRSGTSGHRPVEATLATLAARMTIRALSILSVLHLPTTTFCLSGPVWPQSPVSSRQGQRVMFPHIPSVATSIRRVLIV